MVPTLVENSKFLYVLVVNIPYNGNVSRKKTFTNFAILGAFADVFLQNFSYN